MWEGKSPRLASGQTHRWRGFLLGEVHTVISSLWRKKMKCFPETTYLITQEGTATWFHFPQKNNSFKNQSWTMAKAWLMILWGLYTFQGKYIVNLEIKQIEVQEKPRLFNRPHSLGVMMGVASLPWENPSMYSFKWGLFIFWPLAFCGCVHRRMPYFPPRVLSACPVVMLEADYGDITAH